MPPQKKLICTFFCALNDVCLGKLLKENLLNNEIGVPFRDGHHSKVSHT